MNTANLHLEDLLMPLPISDLLMANGSVDRFEVAHALGVAEQSLLV
jgi:hypothetical protein